MKTIKTTHPKSKQTHRCDLCGCDIDRGERYTYIVYRLYGKLRTMKCHDKCHGVATKMGMMERDTITSYSFIKRVRDYIVELHKRGGKSVKRKAVDAVPISEWVNRLYMFYDDLEEEQNQEPSLSVAQCSISLFTMLFAMPTLIDSLVYELEQVGKYNHKTKKILNEVLKEFERQSDNLAKIYSDTEWLDDFSMRGLDCLEVIESCVSVDGVDKYSNILIGCVDLIVEKWRFIRAKHKCQEQLNTMIELRRKLAMVLDYKEYAFVGTLVNKEFANSKIVITE